MVSVMLPGRTSRREEDLADTRRPIRTVSQGKEPRVNQDHDLAEVVRQVSKLLEDAGVVACGRTCVLEQLLRRQVRYEEQSRSAS